MPGALGSIGGALGAGDSTLGGLTSLLSLGSQLAGTLAPMIMGQPQQMNPYGMMGMTSMLGRLFQHPQPPIGSIPGSDPTFGGSLMQPGLLLPPAMGITPPTFDPSTANPNLFGSPWG